jgi:hypothetical protein
MYIPYEIYEVHDCNTCVLKTRLNTSIWSTRVISNVCPTLFDASHGLTRNEQLLCP